MICHLKDLQTNKRKHQQECFSIVVAKDTAEHLSRISKFATINKGWARITKISLAQVDGIM